MRHFSEKLLLQNTSGSCFCKNWDMIMKGHLEDYEVLVPDDNNSDGNDDEDSSEDEEAKLMMGKVGTKEHSIAGIALAVPANY